MTPILSIDDDLVFALMLPQVAARNSTTFPLPEEKDKAYGYGHHSRQQVLGIGYFDEFQEYHRDWSKHMVSIGGRRYQIVSQISKKLYKATHVNTRKSVTIKVTITHLLIRRPENVQIMKFEFLQPSRTVIMLSPFSAQK